MSVAYAEKVTVNRFMREIYCENNKTGRQNRLHASDRKRGGGARPASERALSGTANNNNANWPDERVRQRRDTQTASKEMQKDRRKKQKKKGGERLLFVGAE